DSDALDQLGNRTTNIDGHEGAGRELDRDGALQLCLALASDRVYQRHEVDDLAGAPRLLGRVEPVPAAARVVPTALRRVEREEPTTLGRLVQARPQREVLGRLPAAVQGDDERQRLRGRPRRNVEAIGAPTDEAVLERPFVLLPGGR